MLILLLVLFEREIAATLDDEVFFHAWVFVQRDDYSAPRGRDDTIPTVLDAREEFTEVLRPASGPV